MCQGSLTLFDLENDISVIPQESIDGKYSLDYIQPLGFGDKKGPQN